MRKQSGYKGGGIGPKDAGCPSSKPNVPNRTSQWRRAELAAKTVLGERDRESGRRSLILRCCRAHVRIGVVCFNQFFFQQDLQNFFAVAVEVLTKIQLKAVIPPSCTRFEEKLGQRQHAGTIGD